MKKFLLIAFLVLCSSLSLDSSAADSSLRTVVGEVVYEAKSDYYIARTEKYYVLLEWYSGPALYKGDVIIGNLHSYGYKDILKDGNDSHVRIYIENYWSNVDSCIDWLDSHGKLK